MYFGIFSAPGHFCTRIAALYKFSTYCIVLYNGSWVAAH